jgi:hypothetical protein
LLHPFIFGLSDNGIVTSLVQMFPVLMQRSGASTSLKAVLWPSLAPCFFSPSSESSKRHHDGDDIRLHPIVSLGHIARHFPHQYQHPAYVILQYADDGCCPKKAVRNVLCRLLERSKNII